MRIKSNKSKKIKNTKSIINLIIRIIKFFIAICIILCAIYGIVINISKIFNGKEFIPIGTLGIITINDDISMKPEIRNTDLIITNKVNNNVLETGDIIAYENNGNLYIHRIVNIENDNGETYYITSGENNYYNNIEKIIYDDIIGKVVLTIPILGFIANMCKNQYVCLFIVVSLIYFLLIKLIKYRNKNKC